MDGFEQHLVLAFFERTAAEVAATHMARALDVEGAQYTVGLLARDEAGRLDATRLGPRVAGGSAAIGAVLGVLALALTGGEVPDHRSVLDEASALSADDVIRIGAELDAGRAAVGVLGTPAAAQSAVLELTRLGGKTEMHGLTRIGLDTVLSAPTYVS